MRTISILCDPCYQLKNDRCRYIIAIRNHTNNSEKTTTGKALLQSNSHPISNVLPI